MTDVIFDDVDKRYRQGDRQVHALRGCSLHIRQGEFFSLLGPSGTGKTTLLNLVAGFETPDGGRVTTGARPVTRPGRDRAVVFQAPTLLPWLTARDNVAQGLRGSIRSRSARRAAATEQLAEVGLADAAARHPYQMSGGMQQRVGIARALVMNPGVLLMDEPFAALDSYVRKEMQQLIVRLQRERAVTTVFVTHSVEEALLLSTRVGVMAAGRLADVFEVPFEHPRDVTSPEFNELRRTVLDRIAAGVRSERSGV
ncbi:ABC transporter ATP-binding protein [Actinacidiphila oryziradicis]|uniref:ABC transporter ATP-binding protein n=1 Tax=Actinacidiphila oryziradicis TaxID=2571141 RepID=UPI0023F14E22|nr:ABC transporter ATP-binding protein [Actinacidiphila oryziradicis]MCW2869634.1 transporter related [Actinacidiphila oryziradicis]